MTDDQLGRLFDQLVPPVPEPLRTAPLVVNPRASVAQDRDKIVITAYGDTRSAEDCGRSGIAVPLRIVLAEPVNGRPVLDAATGQAPPAYRDRDLPIVPAQGWQEIQTEFHRPTGEQFAVAYTRPGGPDLRFMVTAAVGSPPSGAVGDRLVLGGRAMVLREVSQEWTLRWRSGGQDFTLRLEPSETAIRLTRAEARTIIEQLDW